MIKSLLDLVRELNELNDDNLAERVIKDNDVQWCLSELQDVLEAEQSALHPVSREQVEKAWKGKSLEKRGVYNIMWIECSSCRYAFRHASDAYFEFQVNFCPKCGAALTDKAVRMVMDRLEALKDG